MAQPRFFLTRPLGIGLALVVAAAAVLALQSRSLAGPPVIPPGSPEVALLSSEVGAESTALIFQRANDPRVAAPVLTFRHAEGGSVQGVVLPGTRTVLAVAELIRARDPSWTSSLLRLSADEEPRALVGRIYLGTRPLVTEGGRVFVQRGRPGPEPDEEAAAQGHLRTDELTIEEVDLSSGSTRVLHQTRGYIAFLAGSLGQELFVYRVRHRQADLIAVNLDSGEERVLVPSIAPFARDFSVDKERRALLYTQLDEASGLWGVERLDLVGLGKEVLARGPSMALAPHPWPGGEFAFNPDGAHGLSVRGKEVASAPMGPGVDFLHSFSRDGAFALGLHTVESELSKPLLMRTRTGEALLLAYPEGTRLEVAGFLETVR